MWRWASLVTPDFFINLPPDFNWDLVPGDDKPAEEAKAVASEPKKKKPMFRYARVETQRCVDSDLAFCKAIATTHLRASEERGEKMFLRGNSFLSKLAKAVLEQNGDIFVEACQKHKDEAYFNECAGELAKLDFVIEKDKKVDKNAWLGLYEAILLLTEECFATKCDLPKVEAFECKDNDDSAGKLEIIAVPQGMGDEDIASALLAPIAKDGLEDSSDNIKIGELFYEFLNENFPFRENKENLTDFMKEIYSEETCKDLDCFCDAVVNGSLPQPEVKIDAENMLGAHNGDVISINQRLVLDAISGNQKDCFVLFLAMLIEYGHFLGHALYGKTGKQINCSELAGRAFAYWFMECSKADLFNKDFEFADFITFDVKDKEQKFTVKVFSLSQEQRKSIFYSLGTENIWEGNG